MRLCIPWCCLGAEVNCTWSPSAKVWTSIRVHFLRKSAFMLMCNAEYLMKRNFKAQIYDLSNLGKQHADIKNSRDDEVNVGGAREVANNRGFDCCWLLCCNHIIVSGRGGS